MAITKEFRERVVVSVAKRRKEIESNREILDFCKETGLGNSKEIRELSTYIKESERTFLKSVAVLTAQLNSN